MIEAQETERETVLEVKAQYKPAEQKGHSQCK